MADAASFTPEDLEEIDRILKAPNLPFEWEQWLMDFAARHLQGAPASQLLGAPSFVFRVATPITTEESTTSTTFTDLATAGPTLTGLANGRWIAAWGFVGKSSGGTNQMEMGISVNGDTNVSNDHSARCHCLNGTFSVGTYIRHFGILAHSAPQLNSNHNNSLQAKYRRMSGTTTVLFANRWLAALRTGDV